MKRQLFTISASFLLTLFVATTANASLQDELNNLFGSMVNSTAPSSHLGQRRGMISAGSIRMRNKMMNINPITIVPPNIDAGCGGIDVFAGSFSFISADQFVQLLRSIASNASGYAFQLALNALCPSCMNEMSKLQEAIAKINSQSLNSCEAAKSLVNSLGVSPKAQSEGLGPALAWVNTKVGAAADTYAGLFPDTGAAPAEITSGSASALAEADAQGVTGNVVWKALNTQNVVGWSAFGDTSLMEALMSLTGTVIVTLPPAGSTGEQARVEEKEGILDVRSLVEGSQQTQIKMWQCDESVDCRWPSIVDANIEGMETKVRNILLGDGTNPGLIDKFRRIGNVDEPTNAERSFMEYAPASVVAMIRNLAVLDEGTAREFVRSTSKQIALELISGMVDELMKAMKVAVSNTKHELSGQMMERIARVRADVTTEQGKLARETTDTYRLTSYYKDMRTIASMKRERVVQVENQTPMLGVR